MECTACKEEMIPGKEHHCNGTKIWVLRIRQVMSNPYLSIGGVYTSPEKAKEAALFQLQAEALDETINWTPMYGWDDEFHTVIGYQIHEGYFKDCASIDCKFLDAKY